MIKTIKVNDSVFDVIKLLGKGKGGYSYLVSDGKSEYVVKQIHHEPCEYYKFGDKLQSEMNDYNKLEASGINIPKMLDVDKENERILKEYIDGDTIYDLVVKDQVKPQYIDQIREMCRKLYKLHINIDYFPTNFIVNDDKLWYIDFECNDYMDEWNFENWGIKYWSKTPELLKYHNEHKE